MATTAQLEAQGPLAELLVEPLDLLLMDQLDSEPEAELEVKLPQAESMDNPDQPLESPEPAALLPMDQLVELLEAEALLLTAQLEEPPEVLMDKLAADTELLDKQVPLLEELPEAAVELMDQLVESLEVPMDHQVSQADQASLEAEPLTLNLAQANPQLEESPMVELLAEPMELPEVQLEPMDQLVQDTQETMELQAEPADLPEAEFQAQLLHQLVEFPPASAQVLEVPASHQPPEVLLEHLAHPHHTPDTDRNDLYDHK